MNKIHSVALEIVRPGPTHNQLLSPLTAYIALCGGDSPVSVHLPFEQHQLLMRLQRLRYELASGPASEAQTAQRQAEVLEIGKLLGDVLGEIPALLAELSRARCQGRKLVHLRLSLAASELGMVPFETAISPAGFPGTGSPLFLQSHTPITITREIRRGHPLPLQWDRAPNILFAFASPAGLPPVPAEAHLKALRKAIDPWLKIKSDLDKRVKQIKKCLTVLPDASLQDIRDCCAKQHYTHVHILAHGAPFSIAGDKRFGVALCNQEDKNQWDVVDGENLAIALTGKDSSDAGQGGPTLVSLATCDSGNIYSVLTPGGSIAHALHSAGIPWVVASQFPLWMKASTLMVYELYKGILEGEDPRWVLYGLRQKLFTDCPTTHDWASLVVYATVPPDFEQQVEAFRDQRVRGKLEVGLNRLDDLRNAESPQSADNTNELETLSQSLRETLKHWREEPTLYAEPDETAAERFGLSAACEKRIGIAYAVAGDKTKSLCAYRLCRDYYGKAIEQDPRSNWLLAQYLGICAIPQLRNDNYLTPYQIDAKDWWFIAIRLGKATIDLTQGKEHYHGEANLVELHLLGSYYADQATWNRAEAKKQITQGIQKILRAQNEYPIPAIALKRQLDRYRDYWQHKDWNELVEAALKLWSVELNTEDTA